MQAAPRFKPEDSYQATNENYRSGAEVYDANGYHRFGNMHTMPPSAGPINASTISPQAKDGYTTTEMNELPVNEGSLMDAKSGRGNVETSHGGHGFQSGGQFFPNSQQAHYVNNGVGAPLPNGDYFNNMHGGLSTMQSQFPNGAYSYAQPDPYYYNYISYGAPPSNANYLESSGGVVPYDSSAPGSDNKKRSIHSSGGDFHQENFLQDKRIRMGNDAYSRFSGQFGDYHPAAHQMMAMQQHGNYLNHQSMDSPVNMPVQTKAVKLSKTKKQYSGDMPRRPLTAYNFFFSEEREFILAQLPDESESKKQEDLPSDKDSNSKENSEKDDNNEVNPVEKILASMRELSEDEKQELHNKVRANTDRMLTIHKESERVKKPHKKVHGKIAFRYLAKIVGSRWRNLSPDKKKFYEDIAAKDSSRYNEALAEYNKTTK